MKHLPLVLGILIVVGLAGIAGWQVYESGILQRFADDGNRGQGTADVGGPFTLVAQDGHTVSDTDFRGKLMLVYFGYTFCPDVCPTSLQNEAVALDILGDDADDVAPIFITVDPNRDSQQVMAEYMDAFGPRFIGLRGTEEQVAEVAKRYRVYFRKVDPDKDPENYLVDHLSFLYLMGRDGKFITAFGHATTPEEIARGIREYL
ncbi:SCO family protein [Oceanibacterium hippocampi]|uniref:Thioredoxin domain-containing protein n=1 Tax=Oceanibacterium hippocampi TaxID=745714 RepID=A0A1Y5R967_9PROT|nr:SCO family protein [Oceanibacterium hippocampi]SLN12037.1 hypothetical protein OCH7691_00122 [Oceanibacterium hippocampi]